MPDFLHDEELSRLVRELNETSDRPPSQRVPVPHIGGSFESLLREMTRLGASDLLLIPGSPPVFRVAGQIAPADTNLDADEIHAMLQPYVSGKAARLDADGAIDFSIRVGEGKNGYRFRLNIHRTKGELAAAIRALPYDVPTLPKLNLPPTLAALVEPTRGLVLVCGPTGAGKSSTLAALVDEINQRYARHVITIEDPIEYEHRNRRSIVEQIEIGRDAPSFAAALRAAMRQDPDVILVGEMRDLETVATALTAAETGHLILSTLHTGDAVQAIHRIIDVFPATQQSQIRHQLAMSLNGIISQQLVPTTSSRSRVPAIELLLANSAVRNHIRNDKLQNLPTEIQLGKRSGMITFEESLGRLVKSGAITQEEARLRSSRSDDLDSYLRPALE